MSSTASPAPSPPAQKREAEPTASNAPDASTPRLERFGARFVRERAERLPPSAAQLAREAEAFRRLKWLACGRAAVAGIFASGIIATAEVMANQRWPLPVFDHQWRWWAWVLGVTGVFAVAEIAFLIWNALDATSRTARITGVNDWTRLDRPLARAALEMPNPRDAHPAVDPHRESSKLALLALTLLYKAKLAATNFVLKQLFKRLLSRAAVRSVLPFVAVPVTAVWNIIVTLRILRQARLRAAGPRAVEQAVALLAPPSAPEVPSSVEREAILRAVGAAIVRTRDLHPNLEHLLIELERRLTPGPDAGADAALPEHLDDPHRFLALLPQLSPKAQDKALLALGLACALDGRLTRREQALIDAAHRAVKRPADAERWRLAARAVCEGQPLTCV